MRTQSKPEKAAQWLFNTSANWRHLLGFALITALTLISIRFNYELGKLSAVDETSKELLPAGYALLDLCGLFLSGFVGIKTRSPIRKLLAWVWFFFLLSLSLWAAASFTLSVDHRLANTDLNHAITQKQAEVNGLNVEVETWRETVAQAVNFKTKHQNTLTRVQARQRVAADELHVLETSLIAPTMAIYHKAAPYTGFDVDTLALLVRLLWAGAMTLSPLVIALLVVAEFNGTSHDTPQPRKNEPMPNAEKTTLWSSWRGKAQNWRDKRKVRRFMAQPSKNAHNEERHTSAQVTENRVFQVVVPAPDRSNVVPIKGHNAHTQAVILGDNLNGLKYATQWIKKQAGGRITRAKLGHISKVKSREGVTKIIDALIDNGLLIRLNNGQLYTAHNKAVF